MAFEYAVKVICGEADGEVLARGTYQTAINIHNPMHFQAVFSWQLAVALPQLQSGGVFRFPEPIALGPDEALEIDCSDIMRLREEEQRFLKGFVVIRSDRELNVVAVYTAEGATGAVETLFMERVRPRHL